jgi:hypothetical protein
MLLPQFKPVNRQSTKKIIEFKGYNANPVIGDGEIRDGKNLSSSYYPCLAPRGSREDVLSLVNNSGGNDMLTVDGKTLWIDGTKVNYGTFDDYDEVGAVSNTPGIKRSLAVINNKIVIFPDKLFYDIDYNYFGKLNYSATFTNVMGCDTESFSIDTIGFFFPLTAKPYSGLLNVNDIIEISGTGNSHWPSENNKSAKIIKIIGDTRDKDGYKFIWDAEGNELIWPEYNNQAPPTFAPPYNTFPTGVPYTVYTTYPLFYNIGFERGTLTSTGSDSLAGLTLTIKRAVPDMDYVIACDNRLWGVKGNDIYSSALGDVFNWNKFEGVSTDSYATDVDTNGSFTGAAVYNGNPVFFKEDYIHRIYGSTPATYQLITTQAYGVQNGAYKSLVNINDTLFYMSDTGVMAYQGGYPTLISDNFGIKRYTAHAAGTDGRKYYISLNDGTTDRMFVFDTINRVWHVEDNVKAIKFTYSQGGFQMLNATSNKIVTINSGDEVVAWEAELGDYDEVMDYKKGYSRLSLKVELDPGSEIIVYVSHDRGAWIPVKTISSTDKKYYDIPIAPNRCNSFSIKLSGRGFCKVYALDREFYYGGR